MGNFTSSSPKGRKAGCVCRVALTKPQAVKASWNGIGFTGERTQFSRFKSILAPNLFHFTEILSKRGKKRKVGEALEGEILLVFFLKATSF